MSWEKPFKPKHVSFAKSSGDLIIAPTTPHTWQFTIASFSPCSEARPFFSVDNTPEGFTKVMKSGPSGSKDWLLGKLLTPSGYYTGTWPTELQRMRANEVILFFRDGLKYNKEWMAKFSPVLCWILSTWRPVYCPCLRDDCRIQKGQWLKPEQQEELNRPGYYNPMWRE